MNVMVRKSSLPLLFELDLETRNLINPKEFGIPSKTRVTLERTLQQNLKLAPNLFGAV